MNVDYKVIKFTVLGQTFETVVMYNPSSSSIGRDERLAKQAVLSLLFNNDNFTHVEDETNSIKLEEATK